MTPSAVTPQPAISIIVPVHNESGNNAPLIAEIVAALDTHFTFEILYVDDGSTDATLAELADLQATYPMLRVISHDRSYGQSVAVATGARLARYEWLGILDGDGQNDPADLRVLWQWVAAQQPDTKVMAIGQRTRRLDTLSRRLASWLANRLRAALLGDDTPDSGCGLKILSRGLFLELPFFNHMHRFMPALVKRAGGRVVSLPISHRPRGQGVSKYGNLDRLLVGVTDILGVIWLQKRGAQPVLLYHDKKEKAHV